MTDWPPLNVGPIRTWPGTLTRSWQRSPFRPSGSNYYSGPTTLGDTTEVLERELRNLGAKHTELLMAIQPSDLRLDGRPRATAKPEHPGVILSFDSKHGHLSYPCDTFETWQANLRAIALGLEALRKVDRYGVTKHGEQYRGFLAIESSTAMPAGFSTWEDAWHYLEETSGLESNPYEPPEARAPRILRAAKRRAHPDTGGDADTFQRVSLAEAKLREAGLL